MFYFLQFICLSTTTKRKVSFPCFISLLKPLKYYIHDNTSLLVVRFLLLFGALIQLLLLCGTWPQGKKTPCFNNTSLRTKRNSYNKTSLVKNSQRHKESKRAWLRQKQQTEIERHRKSKKDKPCTCSSGDARAERSVWRSVPTFRQDPEGTSYRWQFQVQSSRNNRACATSVHV